MSALADFLVPADEFVLAETLRAAPGMRIEIKRVVGGPEHVTPYFWASGDDFAGFEEALRSDTGVDEVHVLDRRDERTGIDGSDRDRFYRVSWGSRTPELIPAVGAVDGTVLDAASTAAEWKVTVMFPDDGALSEFHTYCLDNEFAHTPRRIYRPENPEERAQYGVTDDQLEALEAAYHEGYFNVPRDVTLSELAETLDISRNALSARLRRGSRNLLSTTLIHEE